MYLSLDIILNVIEAWWFSNTLSSLYLTANLDILATSNPFVLPEWSTSWHKDDKIAANYSISSK